MVFLAVFLLLLLGAREAFSSSTGQSAQLSASYN